MIVFVFNLAVLVGDVAVLAALRRSSRTPVAVASVVALGAGSAGLAIALSLPTSLGVFGCARLASWFLFVHLPAVLGTGAVLWPGSSRSTRFVAGVIALGLVAVAVRAFVVEPRWIEVTHYTIESAKLTEPLRIVLVADVQTDEIGRHERRAFRLAMEAEPDLLLLSGDYIQVGDNDSFLRLRGELQDVLDAVDFGAPLGVFAVRGDVDADAWPTIFERRPNVRATEYTTRFEGPIVTVTALAPGDARSASPPVNPSDRFHVVVGHDPRFALTKPPADLLLAGHTHGGQVQVPGFGPLFTLTTVPRRWAGGGLVELPWGGHLLVSRGIGMERFDAPRLRLFCRPELAVIDVIPAG